MSARLIVVDKDAKYAEWLRHHLGRALFRGDRARDDPRSSSRPSAKRSLTTSAISCCSRPPFGEHSGRSARGRHQPAALVSRAHEFSAAVLTLAEDGNELTAVRALQLGAVDYLPKRLLTPERLGNAVRLALRRIERRVARRQREDRSERRARGSSGRVAIRMRRPRRPRSEEASAEAAEPVPADLVPGYRIVSMIGESEKARVFLAASDALGREIALKVSSIATDEVGGASSARA